MKKRLIDEGDETVTNCNAFKMPAADGKMRLTDVAVKGKWLYMVMHVSRQPRNGVIYRFRIK